MVYKAIAHKLRGPVHIPALLIVQCRQVISHLYSFVAPIVKAGYDAGLSPLFRTSNGSYLIQSKVEMELTTPHYSLTFPTPLLLAHLPWSHCSSSLPSTHPTGLCVCCTSAWNALPPQTHMGLLSGFCSDFTSLERPFLAILQNSTFPPYTHTSSVSISLACLFPYSFCHYWIYHITKYLFYLFVHRPTLEYKVLECRDSFLFSEKSQRLEQCLAPSRYSPSICWMNEWKIEAVL